MELIRISNDKIKISLTKDELDAYELSADDMDCSKAETKEAFREIFIQAREKTGFETDEEKVFVQIFRAKGGGCEIFISKIGKAKRAEAPLEEFFVFEELDELVYACKALKNIGFSGLSSAYIKDESLFLTLISPSDIQLACASEYGEREFLPPSAYMSEYFKIIRKDDAVNILSQF